MKSTRTNRFLGLLRHFFSASAIVMSFFGSASAAVKYFDSASSGTVWNASANWATAAAGPYNTAWATYDEAVFQGTGATITLTTPTCNRITFNANGYTLTGSTLAFGNPGGNSVTVAAGITATISSTINHGYSTGIRLAGTGTLILNGTGNTTNTFPFIADNGTINITGGNTTVGTAWTGDSASTNGKLNVSAGTLTVNGSGSDALTMATRGVGAMTVSGSGQVTAPSLRFGHPSTSGGTGTLNLDGGTLTIGSIFEAGTNNSTFNFNGGTLKASASSTTFMQGLDRANVRNGGAIINSNGQTVTIAQPLLHSNVGGDNAIDGGLTKLGAGTVNLTGAATFTGPTTVTAGTLSMSEFSATSAISVADAAALAITGVTGKTIGGDTGISSLTLGSTAGAGGATLALGNFNSDASYPLVNATALITNAAPEGVVVNFTGGNFTGTGDFPLIWYADASIGGNGFGAFKLGTLPRSVTANLVDNPADGVYLHVSAFNPLVWNGTVTGGAWDIDTTENWKGIGTKYVDGDVVRFDNTATGATAVALNVTVSPASVTVANADYSITGSGAIAGPSSLTKSGPGTLTLGTNNSFTGLTRIDGGTVKLGHANALGSTAAGTSVATGAVLDLNGFSIPAEALTLSGTLVNSGATALSTAAPITLGGAASIIANNGMTLSGAVAAGTNTLAWSGTAAATLSGVISGTATAAVVKSDSGTLTLSANNSYTGSVTVNGGILVMQAVSGTYTYSGGDLFINNGSTLRFTGGRYDLSGKSFNFGDSGGNVLDTSSGLNFVTWAANTYKTVGGPQNTIIGTSGININAGVTSIFDLTRGTGPSDLKVTSPIWNAGGIAKTGDGILEFTGTNTYSGPTLVSGGTLITPATQSSSAYTLADDTTLSITGATGSSLTTGAMTIGTAGATTLNVGTFGGQTLPANAPVKVTGTLTLEGTPTLNLAGYFPGTGTFPVVSFGSLSGIADFTLGTLPRNVVATLDLNTGTNTYDLNISSLNPLFWNGNVNGAWDLATPNWLFNTAAAGFQQTDIVVFNDDAASTAVTLDTQVAPTSVLVNNIAKNYSITGTGGITGTGQLIKAGTGTLTLATANTYAGGTTINAGTLVLGNGITDGSVSGKIVNNSNLVLYPGSAVSIAGVVSGTGTLTKLGAGSFALTTAPTYTGATTLTAGTLQVPALTATSSITNNANLVFNRTDSTEANPAGVITGTGSVGYTGPAVATSTQGQYLVDDVNTYGGGTSITNARVNLTNLAGISTGAVTVNTGGQIFVNAGLVTFTNALTLNGIGWPEAAGSLGALRLQGGPTIATPITLGSTSRISFYGSYGWITGAISGNAELELAANSKTDYLHLTGTSVNTYTGKTTIISGATYLEKVGTPAFFTNVQMGGVTTAQPHLRMLQSNQFGPGVELIPGNTTGNWARFEMQGTNQTLAGINTGNLTTQGGTIIQNRSLDDSGSNWGTATLTLNGGGDYVYNGYLRDSDNGATATNMLAINKTGAGTQTLVGAVVTHTGATTVAAGTLTLQDTTAFASPLTVGAGTTLNVVRTALGFANRSTLAASAITGSGVINANSAGSGLAGGWVRTSGLNFTGTINVNSGVFGTDGNGVIAGSAVVNVAPGAVFTNHSSAAITIGALNGAGDVTPAQSGGGTYNLTLGANNLSGSYAGIIHGNNTTAATDGTIECGFLSLTKIGTGTQTLSGVNTYTGATTINAGTLALADSGTISASNPVTIASGAVLDVSATTSGGFTQGAGKTLTAGRTAGTGSDIVGAFTTGGTLESSSVVNVAGTGIPATLSISGDLTLGGYDTLQLDLSGSTSSGNDRIVSGGALNLADGGVTTVVPTFTGMPVIGTAYPIISYATGTGPVGTGTFTASLPAGTGITGATFDTSVPGQVLMTLAGETKSLVWSGDSAGVWSTDATLTNWNADADNFRNLDSVQFLDLPATAAMTVNVGNTGNLTAIPASMLVNNSTTDYTLATTVSGVIAGGAKLTKTGTALLQISTANTFSGGVVVSQGNLQTGNNTAAGTGAITLGDAGTGSNNISWKWNGSGTPANPVVVSPLGAGTVTIGTYSAGTSTIHSGPMTLNRAVTLADATGDRTSFTGKISGNVGLITVAGTRVTLDNAANDFVGNVMVNSGSVLQLSGRGGSLPDATNLTVDGTLKLNTTSTNETIAGLAGSGTVQNHESVGGTPTLTVGFGNATGYAFTGPINNGSGVLSFAKIGTGTQTLGGVGGFTGTTRIFGGTLALANSAALAGSTLVWDNEGGALNFGTLTAVSIGALQGSQNLSLMNHDTVPAPMALTLGGGNANTSYSGAILGGTTLTKTGTGTQLLAGAASNTYPGLTTVAVGRLGLEKAGAISIPGSVAITNIDGNYLFTLCDNQFGAGSVMTFSGGTTTYGRFELLGTTQTLAGIVDSTARGVTQAREGTAQLVVSPLSTLVLNVPADTSYSYNGYLRSTGGTVALVKNGPGTQALQGGNITYSGGTTLNDGTLNFRGAVPAGPGTMTINYPGVLTTDLAATNSNINGPLVLNGGRITASVAGHANYGNFTLNSTSGVTVIGTRQSVMAADIRAGSTVPFNVGATGDPSGIDLEVTGTFTHYHGVAWGYMTKSGPGVMRFNNPSTSTAIGSTNVIGSVTVNAGKVIFANVIGNPGGNGGLIANVGGIIELNPGSDQTFANPLGGAGVFNKEGDFTFTLSGNSSTLTGPLNVNAGKLAGKAAGAFGPANATRLITVAAGKTLEFQVPNVFGNHGTTAAPIVINAGGIITNFDSLGTARINNGLGSLTLNSATLTSIAGNNLAGDVSSSRPSDTYGAWGLNGTVTSTGTSFITTTAPGAAGRVLLSSSGIDTVINVTDGTLTIATTLQGGDGDSAGLNKTGAGKLVLSAVNVYRGPTTVTAGILELNGSLIKTDGDTTVPSNLTVGGGGTLKGTGIATGTLTANGIIAPGNSIGTLAVGATTFGATGSLTAEINSTTKTSDRLAITGDLNIDADATLTVTDLGAATLTNAKLVLATYTGAWNSVPFFGKPDDSTVVVNGNSYILNYDDVASGANAVTLTLGAGDPFDTWASAYGLTGDAALKGSDPDQDGSNNLLEFATNSDPTQSGSRPRVYPLMYGIGGDNALTYTMAVRKGAVFAAAANPDQKKQTATKDVVVYTIEASNDLLTWNGVEVTEVTGATATAVQTALGATLTAPPLGADWEWHTFRTDAGAPVDPSDLIRLKVMEAP